MLAIVTPDARLARLARRQRGLLTRGQALAAGLTVDQVNHRLASGRWCRVRHGVFAVAGSPVSYEQAVQAAVLGARREAWASHLTAAKLYGLPTEMPTAIDLVVLRSGQVRMPGVRGHTSSCLPAPDLARHHGIPVLSPARLLVDLSAGLEARALGRLIDRAERDGLCRIDDVRRCAARLGAARGRSQVVLAEALALRVPGLGPGDSYLEQEALGALIGAGLPVPVRHHVVEVDGVRYEVDLAYPEFRIAIELLGFRDHGHRSALDDDSERTCRLVVNGWTVLPFTAAVPAAELAASVRRLLDVRMQSRLAG